jgi:hypothetical protein
MAALFKYSLSIQIRPVIVTDLKKRRDVLNVAINKLGKF